MIIYYIEIDEKVYKIIHTNSLNNKIKKEPKYLPLIYALLERITYKQLKEITNKNNVIIFNDLTNCFTYRQSNSNGEANSCICGVKIFDQYFIENKETVELYIIGNECIRHWSPSHESMREIDKEIKKRKYEKNNNENKKEFKLCFFCDKNTSNKQCFKCNLRFYCSNIFRTWAQITNHNKQIKTNVINQWKAYKKDIYTPLLKRFFRKCRIYYKYKNCMKSIITPDKTYILVPFSEISYAKMFGAIFDKDRKMWYFISKSKYLDKYNIQYLDIPIYVKEKVKNIGAKWDNENKKWYCNKDMLLKNEFLNKYI